MTTYGVTPTGFLKKPLTQILSDLQTGIKGIWGQSFDVSDESPMGQQIGVFAAPLGEAWDTMEAVYAAFTPDGATAASLVNLSALTGTRPQPATFSTVAVNLTGTPSQLIPAATFSVVGTGQKFTMDADVTLDGSGNATGVACTAVNSGPVIAAAGTLTVIETARAGLSSVTNPADAALGVLADTDATLRVRRENELRSTGNAATEAVRAAVLAVDTVDNPVTSCTVFQNDTDVTDVNGVPPHAVNALVLGGADADVAQAVFASKGAGIRAYGGTVVSVTDSQSVTHSIGFDRPSELDIYIVINAVVDNTVWNVGQIATIQSAVQAAVVAYGDASLVIGKDVVSSAIGAQAFKVAGMLDAGTPFLGLAPSPVSASPISVSTRQLAKLDTSRVTVNVSFAAP